MSCLDKKMEQKVRDRIKKIPHDKLFIVTKKLTDYANHLTGMNTNYFVKNTHQEMENQLDSLMKIIQVPKIYVCGEILDVIRLSQQ